MTKSTFTKSLLSLPVLLMMGALLVLAGCSLEDPRDPTAQIDDPTIEDAGARYVAVGNSLTAGYMDGGLMMAGQQFSYPKLIAGQLGLNSSTFTQPWIAAPGIGSSTPSDPANVAGVLYFNGSSIAILGETPRADIRSDLLLAAAQPTQYHNLGVPGARIHDAQHSFDSSGGNPFFDFINRAALFGNTSIESGYPAGGSLVPVTYESASQFYQAVAKGGALTTLWLGNNDILGPATSGEPAAGFGNPGSAGALAFQADYTSTLVMLAGGLAQRNHGLKPTIVVANIPSVSSAPYFIPKATFDAVVTSQIGVPWPAGYTESNVQYVLFPALSWITSAAGGGGANPIPASLTLDAAETTDVGTATVVYNTIIANVAAAVDASGTANVGVVNMNGVLAGRSANEKTHFLFLLPANFSSLDLEDRNAAVAAAAATTLFSLDGIHPNSHGQGVMANAFIDVINAVDASSIPHVNPAALPWNPTYGVPLDTPTKAVGQLGLDAKAAEVMAGIWQ
jgi:lysophospholipase L1-like esterase